MLESVAIQLPESRIVRHIPFSTLSIRRVVVLVSSMLILPALLIAVSLSHFAMARAVVSGTTSALHQPRFDITTGEWPPYLDSTAADQGCVARLIRDAFAASGISIHLVFMPWERAYLEGQKPPYIGTAYWYYSPERAKDYLYSKHPVTIENSYFYYLKAHPFEYKSLASLTKHTLVLTEGLTYPAPLVSAIKKFAIPVVESTYPDKNFPLMLAGRGDVTILTQDTAQRYLAQLSAAERANIIEYPEPAFTMAGYLLFNREQQALMAKYDTGLAKILANPEYYAQHQQRCPPFPTSPPPLVDATPYKD